MQHNKGLLEHKNMFYKVKYKEINEKKMWSLSRPKLVV